MARDVFIFILFKDLTKLQPRKIDWDLKRDITPKLQKLERRTQRAIAELIRNLMLFLCYLLYMFLKINFLGERLAAGKADDDLLTAVNAGAQPTAAFDDDDD